MYILPHRGRVMSRRRSSILHERIDLDMDVITCGRAEMHRVRCTCRGRDVHRGAVRDVQVVHPALDVETPTSATLRGARLGRSTAVDDGVLSSLIAQHVEVCAGLRPVI